MGPSFVLVKMGITADLAGAWEERMCQYTIWTVERIPVTVSPPCELDLYIRQAGGFPERECTHLAPHLSDSCSGCSVRFVCNFQKVIQTLSSAVEISTGG